MRSLPTNSNQTGAALILSLILLVVITVLAISGVSTATSELALARNEQNYEYVFQAAEAGLEEVLATRTFSMSAAETLTKTINSHDSVIVSIEYEGQSIVPDKAYSLGSGRGVSAYHFVSTATATSLRDPKVRTDRDVGAVHVQAFYTLGPETPEQSRIHIAGVSQNSDSAVVVVGDTDGNGIKILDLATGDLLWRAGTDASANLRLNVSGRDMDHVFPNQIRVIDLNGDGLADRMYASDLGGQVWRFDINNGQAADQLIVGGIIAQLDTANRRRFYNSPDVSLLFDENQQRRYVSISVGSGDRFFSIRDPDVFNQLRQSDYDNYTIIQEADLVEVSGKARTVITANDSGWKLTLPANHKVLSDSLTFDDQILFVSFTPNCGAAVSCLATQGTNYLYRMNVRNGDPVVGTTDMLSSELPGTQRRMPLQQDSIAASPEIKFPVSGSGLAVACIGIECFDSDLNRFPIRTLWTQSDFD